MLRFSNVSASCDVLVGNSSAGLIEAAALHVPTVNVGLRQAGREQAGNVVNAKPTQQAIRAALEAAQRLERSRLRHPYGEGRAGVQIAQTLAALDLSEACLSKRNTY